MSFDNQLRDWVSANLAQPIPDTIKAFSFNLFELPEDSEVKFGIELVGADRFDASDSDWACNEVWERAERRKELPKSFTGSSWEQCLENVRTVLLAFLANDGAARKLKASYGIGFGFVDGELYMDTHMSKLAQRVRPTEHRSEFVQIWRRHGVRMREMSSYGAKRRVKTSFQRARDVTLLSEGWIWLRKPLKVATHST